MIAYQQFLFSRFQLNSNVVVLSKAMTQRGLGFPIAVVKGEDYTRVCHGKVQRHVNRPGGFEGYMYTRTGWLG